MRRLGLMIVVAAFGAVALNVSVQPAGASAAGCIYINKIYYDSKGADTGSNASLNGEWVRLRNSCSTTKSLADYWFADAAGHTYRFTSGSLAAGATVKVHTGKGSNTASHRYWGRSKYVWGNTKDTARLYDASDALIQSCGYNSSAFNYKVCGTGGYL
jgi:hypothetical protein